jgi:phosphatidylinositol glycan class N
MPADGLQALGYIHREILTILFLIGAFWPLSYGFSFLQQHAALSTTWFLSCIAMSTFTLLPAMKTEDVNLMSVPLVPPSHDAS